MINGDDEYNNEEDKGGENGDHDYDMRRREWI